MTPGERGGTHGYTGFPSAPRCRDGARIEPIETNAWLIRRGLGDHVGDTQRTTHFPLDPAAIRGRGDGTHSQEMFEARKAPDL